MVKLPYEVQHVLSEYRLRLDRELPGITEGIYLQGSIALNSFVSNRSDIDFVTAVSRPLTEYEKKKVLNLHLQLDRLSGKTAMDGYYITCNGEGEMYYVNEGKFDRVNELNPVDKWILNNKGIRIMGPELSFHVTNDELLTYVHENSSSYWGARIHMIEQNKDNLRFLPKEKIDEEIEWSVLGMLRQYYTLKEQGIISKLGAGYYALQHLQEDLHPLICDAIAIREGKNFQHIKPIEERIDKAIKLLSFIHSECKRIFAEENKIRS